jgi:hypothetical protein
MWSAGSPALLALLTATTQVGREVVLLVSVLAGLILVGVLVVMWFKRWQAAEQKSAPTMRVEDYRALMEQGLLDPQEFDRIRNYLENKVPPNPAITGTPAAGSEMPTPPLKDS